MPEVDPARLAQVGGQLTELADQVHTAVSQAGEPTEPDGFACTVAAAQLWAGSWPASLATGARVAQFGDDLTASGSAWQDADTAGAQRFQHQPTR